MTSVLFVPIDRPSEPALYAGPQGDGFAFQCFSIGGELLVDTYHVTFGDALHQIATRMNVDKTIKYTTEAGS